MSQPMNLTPFMVRLTKARPDRLRATIYVAPGRAKELCKRLKDRAIAGWEHSDSTIRVEDPLSLVELFDSTQIMIGIIDPLRQYAERRSFLRQGQKRAPDLIEAIMSLVNYILEIQGD